jgi:thioredoxin-like negative regulator of GroEL
MKQVLYFSAPWCGPCRAFKPLMESLQTEMSITFIDVDSSPQTAQQYNVRSVPTTIVLENGVEKRRLIGAKSKDEIRSAYNG